MRENRPSRDTRSFCLAARSFSARILVMALLGLSVAGCAAPRPSTDVAATPAETGVASYYSDRLHGRTTASGDTYDRNALTAAHRTLPFGTTVVVRNLDNGKSVKLRINDRGPFVKGRILDVSHRAAEALDFLTEGLAQVSVEVVAADRGR